MKLTEVKLDYIVKNSNPRDMLELLAEECSELAQASLKLSRILYSSIPARVTLDDALSNFIEEAGDVEMCKIVLGKLLNFDFPDIRENSKWDRWYNSFQNSLN